jgi:hypothetical protein
VDDTRPSPRLSIPPTTSGSGVAPHSQATRFDKLAARYQATVTIAAINEWLLPDV